MNKIAILLMLLVFVTLIAGCLQKSPAIQIPTPIFTATPTPIPTTTAITPPPIPIPTVSTITPVPTPTTKEISIISDPQGAIVYIDSEYVGTTPLKITLSIGKHFLNLKMNGYLTYLAGISVSDSGKSIFIFQLNPESSGGDGVIPTPTPILQNWVTKEHDFDHTGISGSQDVLTPTICWKNDWLDCPIKIIELSDQIKLVEQLKQKKEDIKSELESVLYELYDEFPDEWESILQQKTEELKRNWVD